VQSRRCLGESGRHHAEQWRRGASGLADRDIGRVDRLGLPIALVSLFGPSLLGGLLTWSWQGAPTALFWAGLVRAALLHRVT
jgi:stearoyl-CoA desaturase (Delta-9 desaturase)